MLLFLDAGANLRAGRPEAALSSIETAIPMMLRASLLPELQLLKGDILAAMPSQDPPAAEEAATWYLRSLEGATQWGARMTVLRAATRLARIEQAAGQPSSATGSLRETYERFTEGHETPDLRAAAELLGAAPVDG